MNTVKRASLFDRDLRVLGAFFGIFIIMAESSLTLLKPCCNSKLFVLRYFEGKIAISFKEGLPLQCLGLPRDQIE